MPGITWRAGALAAALMAVTGLTAAPAAGATVGSGAVARTTASLRGQATRHDEASRRVDAEGSAPARTVPVLPSDQRQVCPVSPQPGEMACQAVVLLPTKAARQARAAGGASGAAQGDVGATGYGPASLRSAYQLASAARHMGGGETIAIVDAHSDPDLAKNLAVYRSRFGLPACTTSSGCLRIVNQDGAAAPLPSSSADWALEESTDVEMVSAICPNCHILLVEAKDATIGSLAQAEDTAAATGARFISNSWAGPEFVGEQDYDKYFDHPGDAITVAAGDSGYSVWYPTASQFVTAVGGTTLSYHASGSPRWTQAAWGEGGVSSRFGNMFGAGTGSGCSMLEPKPSWQTESANDGGCLNRTVNDVSAIADPNPGVAVYDTFGTSDYGGPWLQIGGTSVATPIIAATYALAGRPMANTYPASYPYRHASALTDVTKGENGNCEASRRYLCQARRGYDGPTGLGTPVGVGAFSDGGARPVTLVDPGVQDEAAGSEFSLRITGLDANTGATSLAYQATGLPAGLSIRSVPGTTDAEINGILPDGTGSSTVTVTATDGTTGQRGSATFAIVTVPSLVVPQSAPGSVSLAGEVCLDDGGGGVGTAVLVAACSDGRDQQWSYQTEGAPGSPGTLTADSLCVGQDGSQAELQSCQSGDADQGWTQPGFGMLKNAGSGLCMTVPRISPGEDVQMAACVSGAEQQRWTLPAGLLVSAVGGLCAYTAGVTTSNFFAAVKVVPCDAASPAQEWSIHPDGTLRNTGNCLDVIVNFARTALDGAAAKLDPCAPTPGSSQTWLIGPGGELINDYSGRCLTDNNGGGSGTALVQEDCYGEPGQIWAVN